MRRWLNALTLIILVSLIIGVGAYFTSVKERKVKPGPKVVVFPFSWEEKGYPEDYTLFDSIKQVNISITVVNVTYFGKIFGSWEAEEGYQYYGVYVKYKNLGHQKYYRPSGYDVGVSLELVTNRSNIYKPGNGFFSGTVDVLKPEEEKGEWIRFLIQMDEKPVELSNYEAFHGEPYVAYVWKIE